MPSPNTPNRQQRRRAVSKGYFDSLIRAFPTVTVLIEPPVFDATMCQKYVCEQAVHQMF